MKSVLLSIQPKWCTMIAEGKKTVEIRKTKPRIETPFKVYIYCTKKLFDAIKNGSVCDMWGKRQKVIGEFVCYDISTYCTEFYSEFRQPIFEAIYQYNEEQDVWQPVLTNECAKTRFAKETCLTLEDFRNYLGVGENQFYGWKISDLIIYDEPKSLDEFQIETPPQSWCYVR